MSMFQNSGTGSKRNCNTKTFRLRHSYHHTKHDFVSKNYLNFEIKLNVNMRLLLLQSQNKLGS